MIISKPLIIICAGGLAREVLWLASECSEMWHVVGYLDDTDSLQATTICGSPVLGKIDDWTKYPDAYFVVALGDPRNRKAIVERMEANGRVNFATLIHPSVKYSKFVQIGEGSIVTAGCIITTQVRIGRHCIINLSSTIGHDVIINDYCTLAPQSIVSGNVELGAGVEVGTGATIIEKNIIGSGSFVGAGSIISKNLEENGCFVGNPARRIKSLAPFLSA